MSGFDQKQQTYKDLLLKQSLLGLSTDEEVELNMVQDYLAEVYSARSRARTVIDARPKPGKPICKLYHVVQLIPQGVTLQKAHIWGKRILKMKDVGAGSCYVLEQTGESEAEMGSGMHLHFILYFPYRKGVLLQRITSKRITLPNLTEVTGHDNVNALRSYLEGNKDDSKVEKVRVDRLWREKFNRQGVWGWVGFIWELWFKNTL